jgi:hypothetical protein
MLRPRVLELPKGPGAAFVGAIASTLAVADILRGLHDGPSYSVIALDLREPNLIRASANSAPGEYLAKFTAVRWCPHDLT